MLAPAGTVILVVLKDRLFATRSMVTLFTLIVFKVEAVTVTLTVLYTTGITGVWSLFAS